MTDQSTPRHQQITDHLRTEIARKEFLPGDKLPSEKGCAITSKLAESLYAKLLKHLKTMD